MRNTHRRTIVTARSYRRSLLVTPVTERWMPVVGWEDSYHVSDTGRVRSLDRQVVEKTGRVRRNQGRVLVANMSHGGSKGLPRVTLSAGGQRKCCYVHVLVRAAFNQRKG